MPPKPAHLGPRYGAQFGDASIAAAYRARPPYPQSFFELLRALHAPGARRILDLGSGTGDVALGLVDQCEQIDAVEPSASMLQVAQQREGAADRRIRWIHARAEDAQFDGRYTLAVAGESLHWMEWGIVFPKLVQALAPGAFLVLAERAGDGRMPWDAELTQLIPKYSTNQEFRPYDLVNELATRGLFKEAGRCRTPSVAFAQSIADHIESMHSRNGFSRDRMDKAAAAEFDEAFRQLLKLNCADGVVRMNVSVNVIWGWPAAA
jgi:SAM-dependent methyltransferase